MKGELTAIIEKAPEGGFWAICPEVPGANGQGKTIEDAKKSLRDAAILILEDRLFFKKRREFAFPLDESEYRCHRSGPSSYFTKHGCRINS